MNKVISSGFRRLPFSGAMTGSMISGCAGKLLALFQLQGKTRVIAADAQSGIDLERQFRRRWWEHMNDPLKLRMHNLGIGIEEKVSEDPSLIPALHNAWLEADRLTQGIAWRKLIRQLSSGNEAGKQYIRIFFRIAQQMVNRGARWEAVFGTTLPLPIRTSTDLLRVDCCHWAFTIIRFTCTGYRAYLPAARCPIARPRFSPGTGSASVMNLPIKKPPLR